MQGEFRYQNYMGRWISGLPLLALYIFFWADMLFWWVQPDILYYILNVAGLILLMTIYYGITKRIAIFTHVGSWSISGDILTIVMGRKRFDVTICDIDRMAFITNKQLFRFISRFHLMEIHADNKKIKIFSPDLDKDTTYDSDLFFLYQTVKKHACHLKLDMNAASGEEINEWLKKEEK